jgi:rubrerythrin
MAEFLKANELLEFAVQIEKNGEAYYRAAANKTKNSKLKDIFMYLAEQEVEHKNIYEKMLKSVESYEPKEMYPEEYFQYLRAYADNHIFVKKEEIEKKAVEAKSDVEAIGLALGFEKDSILYYLEIKNFVPDGEKNIVDKIIEEEHKHYNKLTEIKKII